MLSEVSRLVFQRCILYYMTVGSNSEGRNIEGKNSLQLLSHWNERKKLVVVLAAK